MTLTADAAAVTDGAQTVTATVSASTFDPNSANNTASATETSQPPPVKAIITVPPGATPVNVCATSPDSTTTTLYGSVQNAANPDAPPSSVEPIHTLWFCDRLNSTAGCPTPVTNVVDTPYVTYNNDNFTVGNTYTVGFSVIVGNQTPYRTDTFTQVSFVAVCLQ